MSVKKEAKSKKRENYNKLGKSIIVHQSSRKSYSTSHTVPKRTEYLEWTEAILHI